MPDLGDLGSIAAAAIALLALVYTGFIHRRQNAQAREQTALQSRMVAIEEGRDARALEDQQRATMVAWLDRREPGGPHATQSFSLSHGAKVSAPIEVVILVVKNKGQALARQVGCTVAAIDQEDIQVIGLEALPRTFRPDQREEFQVVVQWQTAPTLRVVLTWADGIRADNEEEYECPYPLTRRHHDQ